MKKNQKSLMLWLLLGLMVLLIANVMKMVPGSEAIDYSRFRQMVRTGMVESVVIRGSEITGKFKPVFDNKDGTIAQQDMALAGKNYRTYAFGTGEDLIKLFEENKIAQFTSQPNDKAPFWQLLLSTWLPIVAMIVLFVFIMRQVQAGGGKALSFGKSRARRLTENQKRITFADVAGVDEAKQELQEIIEFLKEPKKFTRLGGRIPKGVLLVGPPGTGKTLLARAIAGEAGVPFFSISGSDFVEMFVGVGASRVRDLFEQGKKSAPCIIFIDEIDAVGRQRGAGWGGGHDEREQTLNQLLVEMDGFETSSGVILISATNRPDVLDPALLRPGRFDRRVVVPIPDVKGRIGIIKVHTSKTPLAADVDPEVLARGTPGFSGADLENMVNEAALIAAREGKNFLDMQDFERAKDKVMMGSERRSMIISDEEKRITAYHEAGHALVAKLLPGTDPVHKVTIIPRGMALGLTQLLPKEDKYTFSQEFAENQIAYMMGGRCAEEVIFKQRTTGAGNDIERATELAKKMVCNWGMSEKVGPLNFGKEDDQIFLGKDFAQRKDYSESTAQVIDAEVRRIVQDNYQRALNILKANTDKLENLAKALLEFEVIDGEDIDRAMRGEVPLRKNHLQSVKGTATVAATESNKSAAASSTMTAEAPVKRVRTRKTK